MLVVRCAGVAQLVELLICNQPVAGSSPVTSFSLELHGATPWGFRFFVLVGILGSLSCTNSYALIPKTTRRCAKISMKLVALRE